MYEAFTLFGGTFQILPLISNFLTLPVRDSGSVTLKTTFARLTVTVLFNGRL